MKNDTYWTRRSFPQGTDTSESGQLKKIWTAQIAFDTSLGNTDHIAIFSKPSIKFACDLHYVQVDYERSASTVIYLLVSQT